MNFGKFDVYESFRGVILPIMYRTFLEPKRRNELGFGKFHVSQDDGVFYGTFDG